MHIKYNKQLDKSKSVNFIKSPVRYSPADFGFSFTATNPTSVKIAILDTGCPIHCDIPSVKENNANCVDMLSSKTSVFDMHGHACLVSGVLCSSNPNTIMGMCPSAKYYFCKVMDDIGDGDTSNLTAGMLWALSQDCDIILMSNGSAIEDRYMKILVEKCFKMNKILVVASGREVTKSSKCLFPAAYDGIFSCTSARSMSCVFKEKKNRIELDINVGSIWSTFLNDSYMKCGGSSMAAAITCGVIANFMEYLKINNICWETTSDFMRLFAEKFINK